MNTVCIDIGSYNVKFFECRTEKKSLVLEQIHEVNVENTIHELGGDITAHEAQMTIVQNYLEQLPRGIKTIFQLPNAITSPRYLTLPTNSRKKAEMMVPFQLEDEIPFASDQYHFGYTMQKGKNQMWALAITTSKELFSNYYDELIDRKISPTFLTSEISTMQSMVEARGLSGNFCILDLGHKTSKAYFFKDKRIVSYHTSHVAGEIITQVISEHYNISMEDATNYKHQDAFLLTKAQYHNVDNDQKSFAMLMKKVLSPLVSDLSRWMLGFRVGHSSNVNKIFITGGTSNLKNIQSFLAQETHANVDFLDLFEINNLGSLNLSKAQRNNYHVGFSMGESVAKKKFPINFLCREFAIGGYEDLPLHSAAFIGLRVMAVTAMVLFAIFLDSVFLQMKITKLDKMLKSVSKNPTLALTQMDKRRIKTKTEASLKKFLKKKKEITQEISTITSSSGINAIQPLFLLSNILPPNENIVLEYFESKEGVAKAEFSAKDTEKLNELEETLKNVSLPAKLIDKKGDKVILTFDY